MIDHGITYKEKKEEGIIPSFVITNLKNLSRLLLLWIPVFGFLFIDYSKVEDNLKNKEDKYLLSTIIIHALYIMFALISFSSILGSTI